MGFFDSPQWQDFIGGLPHLIFAIIVLLVGWLIVKAIGGTVSKVLIKTGVGKTFSKWFSSDDSDANSGDNVCRWIGKGIYYILLVFVLLIFFNMLHLTIITEPLVNMLNIFTGAIPNIIQAGLMLLLAWVLATILKVVVEKGSHAANLDSLAVKVNIAEDEESAKGFISTLAKIVYYLIFVLFLPAILNPLNIAGLTQPVSDMISQFLNILPDILAAVIIVLIGWFIAKIVRDILTSFLRSVGTENLGEKVGLTNVSLSTIIGTIAYVLILIPTVITALRKVSLAGISKPAINMLNEAMTMIPNIIVAAVLVFLGAFIGRWVFSLVASLLEKVGFDSILPALGIQAGEDKPSVSLSQWVGRLAQVVVILLFVVEALQVLHLSMLVTIVMAVIAYLPSLFVSILILGIGLYLGNLVQRILSNVKGMDILGAVSKYVIFGLALFMALDQLHIADSIVNSAFILTLGALAVAFAISFGIGGREFAAQQLEKLSKRINKDDNE